MLAFAIHSSCSGAAEASGTDDEAEIDNQRPICLDNEDAGHDILRHVFCVRHSVAAVLATQMSLIK